MSIQLDWTTSLANSKSPVSRQAWAMSDDDSDAPELPPLRDPGLSTDDQIAIEKAVCIIVLI